MFIRTLKQISDERGKRITELQAKLDAVRELAETWDRRKTKLPDPLAREIYRICAEETRKILELKI